MSARSADDWVLERGTAARCVGGGESDGKSESAVVLMKAWRVLECAVHRSVLEAGEMGDLVNWMMGSDGTVIDRCS